MPCRWQYQNNGACVMDGDCRGPQCPDYESVSEEGEQHRIGISRRKHAHLFNASFSPSSLYSTLTLNDEYEVHTFQEARRLRDNYYRRLRFFCHNG